MAFGWRVYGLGVMAVGLACLAFGDFGSGQPVPAHFPARTALAYIAGVLLILAAVAVEWRRTAAWGAATLTVYYGLFVVSLMNGRLVFGCAHFVYMNLTAPLIPKWLPPTQEFWGYATGVCFIADRRGRCDPHRGAGPPGRDPVDRDAGVFALLVHEPMLLADHP